MNSQSIDINESQEDNQSERIKYLQDEMMEYNHDDDSINQNTEQIQSTQDINNDFEIDDFYNSLVNDQAQNIFLNNNNQQEKQQPQVNNKWIQKNSEPKLPILQQNQDNLFLKQDSLNEKEELADNNSQNLNSQDKEINIEQQIQKEPLDIDQNLLFLKINKERINGVLLKLEEDLEQNTFFYKKCLKEQDQEEEEEDEKDIDLQIEKIVNNVNEQTKIFQTILDRIKLGLENDKKKQSEKQNYQQTIEQLKEYLQIPENDFFFIKFDNITKEFQNNENLMKNYNDDKKQVGQRIEQIRNELKFDNQNQTAEQKNFQLFKKNILQKNLFVFHNNDVMYLEIYKLINQTKDLFEKNLQKEEQSIIKQSLLPLNKFLENIIYDKFKDKLEGEQSQDYIPNLVDSFLFRNELDDLKKQNKELEEELKKQKNSEEILNEKVKKLEIQHSKEKNEYEIIIKQNKDEFNTNQNDINYNQQILQNIENNSQNQNEIYQKLKLELENLTQIKSKITEQNQQSQEQETIIQQYQDKIDILKNNIQQLKQQNLDNQKIQRDEYDKLKEKYDNYKMRFKKMKKQQSLQENQIQSKSDDQSFSQFLKESDDISNIMDYNNQPKNKSNENIQLKRKIENLTNENKLNIEEIIRLNRSVDEYRLKFNQAKQDLFENEQNINVQKIERICPDQTKEYQQLKYELKKTENNKQNWKLSFTGLLIAFMFYIISQKFSLKKQI